MITPPQVVVTGMGAVSPVGLTCRETFTNLVRGTSGVGRITHFDPSRHASQIAAEVKHFNPLDYMDHKPARRIGRYAQFAIAAAKEAVAHAKLDLTAEDLTRIASLVATSIADFPMLEEHFYLFFRHGPGNVNPFLVPRVSYNMAAANVSLVCGLTGPSFGVASACASGSHALAVAWLLLKAGLADVALAGGTEAAITPAFLESYIAMRALSTRNDDPPRASRPFDKDRDGFVLGEGCAVLILETLDHARQRRGPILAELAGVGMTCDAYHITAPHPDGSGAAAAIALGLKSAGLTPEQVDYINAHGTATLANDPIETLAVKRALGDHAYRVPCSSIKSMIGHSIGAAGALEAMTCVMALNEDLIPPTINLDNPDPACDLDYVPRVARKKQLNVVISNSFAFGGQNCVLVFKRYDN